MTTQTEALKLALEALESAVRYHGIMLMSDPPQDAWKYHRVENKADKAITAIKEALAQPEQEPVAWLSEGGNFSFVPWQGSTPLYTSPPQRTWVGLTPQERDEINEQVYGAVPHHVAFHHAIEAKLRSKNNG